MMLLVGLISAFTTLMVDVAYEKLSDFRAQSTSDYLGGYALHILTACVLAGLSALVVDCCSKVHDRMVHEGEGVAGLQL